MTQDTTSSDAPVGSHVLPAGDQEYEVRILAICVIPQGHPIFSELTTKICIDSEGSDEFVKVTQVGGHTDLGRSIGISKDEWPTLRESIDYMISQCRQI